MDGPAVFVGCEMIINSRLSNVTRRLVNRPDFYLVSQMGNNLAAVDWTATQ